MVLSYPSKTAVLYSFGKSGASAKREKKMFSQNGDLVAVVTKPRYENAKKQSLADNIKIWSFVDKVSAWRNRKSRLKRMLKKRV